jgi:hypothetical protein
MEFMNSTCRETILHTSMYTLRDLVCNGQMCPDRKCGPRLSAAAAEKLKNRYVVMRSGAREHERESDRRASIPITVRYFTCQRHYQSGYCPSSAS